MNLDRLLARSAKFMTDNSPTILTAIGVTGTLTTAYLTHKATKLHIETIEYEKRKSGELVVGKERTMTRFQEFKLVAPCYIAPVSMAALTVTAIIYSNRINMRRMAVLATAYTALEQSNGEYRSKVAELLGKGKEQKVRDSLAQDRVTANPPDSTYVIHTGRGDVLFRDALSGRYFTTSVEEVKRAENHINHAILRNNYSSVSELYSFLGLDSTSMSDDFGWNNDRLLDIDTSSTALTNEGKPCIVMNFSVDPIRDFFRAH